MNVLVISFCLKGAGVLLFASKSMLDQDLKQRAFIHANRPRTRAEIKHTCPLCIVTLNYDIAKQGE